jgi:RNA polymerase primary sigma factor
MLEEENQDHMGLVYRVAQELANKNETCIKAFGRDVSEYLGEGYLALQIAKKGFDPKLGFKFSTYATEVIKDRLLQAARRASLIKISFQARYEASRFLSGKTIDPKNEQKVKAALLIMQGSRTAINPDLSPAKEDPLSDELNEELHTRLSSLDERTRQIVIMRYGLDGQEPLTLEEVGKRLNPNLTRERVRQIEKDGLNRLKQSFNV